MNEHWVDQDHRQHIYFKNVDKEYKISKLKIMLEEKERPKYTNFKKVVKKVVRPKWNYGYTII